MPANLSNLQAAIDSLKVQLETTKTVSASAAALISGFAAQISAAVAAAIAADDSIDNAAIAVAEAAINDTTKEFLASSTALGDAVVAGTPSAPPA